MKKLTNSVIFLCVFYSIQTVYAQKPVANKTVKPAIVKPITKTKLPEKAKATIISKSIVESESKEPVDTFSLNGKYGFKTAIGRIVLTPQYDELFHGQRSIFFYARLNGKYGIYNYAGKLVVPVEFDMIRDETRDYIYQFTTNKNGKWGAFDTLGNHLILELYESVSPNRENKGIGIKNNGKWACADSTGKLRTDFLFDNFMERSTNSEPYTAVAINGKWGFLRADYTLAIDYKYDNIFSNFYEGKAYVSYNGVKGFINYAEDFEEQKANLTGMSVSTKSIEEDVNETVQKTKKEWKGKGFKLISEGETTQFMTVYNSEKVKFVTFKGSSYTLLVISKDIESIGMQASMQPSFTTTHTGFTDFNSAEATFTNEKGNVKIFSVVLGSLKEPLGTITFIPVGKTTHKVKYLLYEYTSDIK